MTLDFDNLTDELKLQIDKIYNENQHEFENLQKNILTKNHSNLNLLLSNIISRNNDENSIFYNICLIELALNIAKEKNITKIITLNDAQSEILKNTLSNKIEISTKKKFKIFQINKFILNILKFLKNFNYVFRLFLLSSSKRKQEFKELKNITLIDIFFIPKMFINGNFTDRYYGKLSEIKNKELVFIPTFYHNAIKKEYIKLARKKINIILICDFLKLQDYFKALFFFRGIKKINISNVKFKSTNIEKLILEELSNNKFNLSIMISFLNYCFFKRIKDEKINLKLVIDWYENQIVDKGFNYGKNIFYKNVKSKGFIGLNSILEINNHFIPSIEENKKKLSPNEICLINPKYFKKYKELRPDLKISLAPALRNSEIFNSDLLGKKNSSKKTKVLINFTGSYLDNIEMINLINNCNTLRSKEIDVFIRPHQVSNKDLFLKNICPDLDYKFSTKLFYDEIKDTNIFITRSSTACFESITFGIPTLITRRYKSILPTKNFDTFPSNLWFFVKNNNDLEKYLNEIIFQKSKYILKEDNLLKKFLNDYFYPVNDKNIEKLLDAN